MSLSLPAPLYPLVHVLVATVHRTTGTRGNRKEKKERKLEILKVVITFKPFLILAISRDKCSSSSSSKEKFAELRKLKSSLTFSWQDLFHTAFYWSRNAKKDCFCFHLCDLKRLDISSLPLRGLICKWRFNSIFRRRSKVSASSLKGIHSEFLLIVGFYGFPNDGENVV